MASKTGEKETRSLESALKEHPGSLLFARLADAYRKEGNILQAIELCNSGIARYPEYVTARILLGRCYLEQQQADLAVKEFTTACSIDRRNHVAIKMLADTFIQQGMEEKAGDLFALLRTMDPDNISIKHLCSQYPSSGSTDLYSVIALTTPSSPPQNASYSAPASTDSMGTANDQNDFLTEFTTDDQATDASGDFSLPSGDDFDALFNDTGTEQATASSSNIDVSGSDISERMSELFGETAPSSFTSQAELGSQQESFTTENSGLSDFESTISNITESSGDLLGDDVSDRIGELFADTPKTSSPVKPFSEQLTNDFAAPESMSLTDDTPELSLSGQDFDFSDIADESTTTQSVVAEEQPENASVSLDDIDLTAFDTGSDTFSAAASTPDFDADVITLQNANDLGNETPTGEDFLQGLDSLFGDSEESDSSETATDTAESLPLASEAPDAFSLGMESAANEPSLELTNADTDGMISGDDVSDQLSALFANDKDVSPDESNESVGIDMISTSDSSDSADNNEYDSIALDSFSNDSYTAKEHMAEKSTTLFPDTLLEPTGAAQNADSDDVLPFEEQTVIINRSDASHDVGDDFSDSISEFNITPDGESLSDQIDLLFPEDAASSAADDTFLPGMSDDSVAEAPIMVNENSDTELTGADVMNRINDIFQTPTPPSPVAANNASPSGEDISEGIDNFFNTSQKPEPRTDTYKNDLFSDSEFTPEAADHITELFGQEPLVGDELPTTFSFDDKESNELPFEPDGTIETSSRNTMQREAGETIFDQMLPPENSSSDIHSLPSFDELTSFESPDDASMTEEDFTPPAFAETLQFDSVLFDKMLNPEDEESSAQQSVTPPDIHRRENSEHLDGATEAFVLPENDSFDVVDLPIDGHLFSGSTTTSPFSDEEVSISGTILPSNVEPSEDLILESTATFEVSSFSDNTAIDLPLISESDEGNGQNDDFDLSDLITDDSSIVSRPLFENFITDATTQSLDDAPSGSDVAGKIDALFFEPTPEERGTHLPSAAAEDAVDLTKEYLLDDIAAFTDTASDDENDVSLIETMQFTNELLVEPDSSAEVYNTETHSDASALAQDDAFSVDEVDANSMISSVDLEERLDAFFPTSDLMSLSSSLQPLSELEDDEEVQGQTVSDFYTISGEDAANGGEDAIPESLDNVEFVEEAAPTPAPAPVPKRQIYSGVSYPERANEDLPETSGENIFEDFPAETVAYSREELTVPSDDTPDARDDAFDIPDHVLTPTLADLYFQQGQYKFALQVFSRLLGQDPDNPKLLSRYNEIKSIVDYHEKNPGTVNSDTESIRRRAVRPPKAKEQPKDSRPLAGVRIKKRVTTPRKNSRDQHGGKST